MLFEKPMWVWKNAQYKSILVYLNNGIMISANGHDTSPLKWCYDNNTRLRLFRKNETSSRFTYRLGQVQTNTQHKSFIYNGSRHVLQDPCKGLYGALLAPMGNVQATLQYIKVNLLPIYQRQLLSINGLRFMILKYNIHFSEYYVFQVLLLLQIWRLKDNVFSTLT